jgi:hypothetical protein
MSCGFATIIEIGKSCNIAHLLQDPMDIAHICTLSFMIETGKTRTFREENLNTRPIINITCDLAKILD